MENPSSMEFSYTMVCVRYAEKKSLHTNTTRSIIMNVSVVSSRVSQNINLLIITLLNAVESVEPHAFF